MVATVICFDLSLDYEKKSSCVYPVPLLDVFLKLVIFVEISRNLEISLKEVTPTKKSAKKTVPFTSQWW